MSPTLLVIAGPNGAGKTTVTVRLRADHWSEGVEYLNPDDVARDRFGDWNAPDAVLRAARWAEAQPCSRTHDGQLRKVYGHLPAWVSGAVEQSPRHPAFVDARRAG